jgi:hypothetical protein
MYILVQVSWHVFSAVNWGTRLPFTKATCQNPLNCSGLCSLQSTWVQWVPLVIHECTRSPNLDTHTHTHTHTQMACCKCKFRFSDLGIAWTVLWPCSSVWESLALMMSMWVNYRWSFNKSWFCGEPTQLKHLWIGVPGISRYAKATHICTNTRLRHNRLLN